MSKFLALTSNKTYFLIFAIVALPVSALSAWRLLAIWGSNLTPASSWSTWLGWLGLTAALFVLWLVAVEGLLRLFRLNKPGTRQPLLAALLGAMVGGLIAFLLTSPAGLSRLTLELYAQNVWSPTSFSVDWVKDGLWDAPFTLPIMPAAPLTAEILPTAEESEVASTAGQAVPAASGEIWLVRASHADGSVIPLADFQAAPSSGWSRQKISWGAYKDYPVWIFRPGSAQVPAGLQWSGDATGPLTLVFARSPQSGSALLRWNGQEQTLNLHAQETGFAGVTLPVGRPVVWRASLPLNALPAEEMNLSMEADPGGNYAAVLQKLNLVGLPGQNVELSGPQLVQIWQVKDGRTEVTAEGVRLIPSSTHNQPQLFLTTPPTTALSGLMPFIPGLENGLLVLYVAVLGGLLVGGVARLLPVGVVLPLNRMVISIMVMLFIGEMGPRLYFPAPGQYYVWPPGLHRVFKPDPQALPGISGDSNFIVNSQGIRGDEFGRQDDYRILTIGASTTECLYLDQNETWPHLVQEKLNERSPNSQVWVGNIGKSARKTPDHVLQLKYLLPQYPRLDAVILLLGASDLFLTLRWGDGENNPYYSTGIGTRQAALKRAFDVVVEQDPFAPYYEQTAMWRIINRIRQAQTQVATLDETEVEDEAGRVYIERRQKRQESQILDELPDLSVGLAEYARNVNNIINVAQAHGVRIILMTQPTLWRPDLSQQEEALLWLGQGPGRKYFYSPAALEKAMTLYNQQLLDICQQRQVECIDLAPAIPKTGAMYYDDAHFTEAGAREVADFVADYLTGHPPFSTR